jgi:hypothetical protein
MLLSSPAKLIYYIEQLVISYGTTTPMSCGGVPAKVSMRDLPYARPSLLSAKFQLTVIPQTSLRGSI